MTIRLFVAACALVATTACHAQAVLTQQVEAQRLTTHLRADFSKVAEGSVSALGDVARDVEQLRTVLTSMGYSEELAMLQAFVARFDEFKTLSAQVDPHRHDVPTLESLLGRRRLVTAESADQLRALQEALDAHTLGPTR